MYIVLNKDIKDLKKNDNGYYEITTYNKRFFNETIVELSNGGSAYKNYELGDKLYFYDIKDSLDVKYLETNEGLYTFKVYEELNYFDIVKNSKKSLLRLFKFAENLEIILASKNKELAIKELFDNFSLNDLTKVYQYLIKVKKDTKNSNYTIFLSKYENYLLEKLYKEYEGMIIFEMTNILCPESINKQCFLNLFSSILSKETVISQEFIETGENIFYIKDNKIKEELLLVYIKSFNSLISINKLEVTKESIVYIVDYIESNFNEIKDINYNEKNKDSLSCIKLLITNIKNFLN